MDAKGANVEGLAYNNSQMDYGELLVAVFHDDDIATEESIKATHNKASIYILLGDHPRIAKFLRTDPTKTCIELEYYSNGNLKSLIEKHRPCIEVRKCWARQIVQSAEYIHTMGVRHSMMCHGSYEDLDSRRRAQDRVRRIS